MDNITEVGYEVTAYTYIVAPTSEGKRKRGLWDVYKGLSNLYDLITGDAGAWADNLADIATVYLFIYFYP